jgi:hypothetical protein
MRKIGKNKHLYFLFALVITYALNRGREFIRYIDLFIEDLFLFSFRYVQ